MNTNEYVYTNSFNVIKCPDGSVRLVFGDCPGTGFPLINHSYLAMNADSALKFAEFIISQLRPPGTVIGMKKDEPPKGA